VIRIATPAETEPITRLINIAFEVEKFFIDGDRIDPIQVRDLFEKGFFLVIDGDNGLAGCVYVEPRGPSAYLGLLSIHPLIQGQGFGARLVRAAEDHARALGCEAMDLRVVDLRLECMPVRIWGTADPGERVVD